MAISRVITREQQLSRIKQMGRWIEANADNILGEYPGAGITSVRVSCNFKLDLSEWDSLEIKREHLMDPIDGQADEIIYWDENSYE